MHKTPGDECPIGTMPEPGDQEDGDHVEMPAHARDATSAERKIDVVTEPS